MRDCIQQIFTFNKGFDRLSLQLKLKAMAESPFSFFRATFHLFAADLKSGPFQKLAVAPASGRMVADLHTENFGGYRTASGDLVYDINDFDDTAVSLYEYDLRRLLTSILLGGAGAGLRAGFAVNACETAVQTYLKSLESFKASRDRADFANLQDPRIVRKLLKVAEERSHEQFIRKMVEPRPKGGHQFVSGTPGLAPITGEVRQEAGKRFKEFLKNSTLPDGAERKDFILEDVVFRFAGKGSLGKNRFALLVRQGKTDADLHLRILEWKDSTNSPMASGDASHRKQSKDRNKEVCDATVAFQLHPRRFLGYVSVLGQPMQAREIGANDCRFDHSQYADPEKLEKAAEVFGGITARAHLLSSLGEVGPRKMLKESGLTSDRFVARAVSFAVSYANRVHEDYFEFRVRSAELAKAWKVRLQPDSEVRLEVWPPVE